MEFKSISPDEKSEEQDFELDESQIRTGQPTERMAVIRGGDKKNKREFTWWATYEGSVDGYQNISGYGNSEDEAKQDLKEKIANYYQGKKK